MDIFCESGSHLNVLNCFLEKVQSYAFDSVLDKSLRNKSSYYQ